MRTPPGCVRATRSRVPAPNCPCILDPDCWAISLMVCYARWQVRAYMWSLAQAGNPPKRPTLSNPLSGLAADSPREPFSARFTGPTHWRNTAWYRRIARGKWSRSARPVNTPRIIRSARCAALPERPAQSPWHTTGQSDSHGPSQNIYPPKAPCSRDSGYSTAYSRSPAVGAPRCPAALALARPCCRKPWQSGAMPT